MKKTLVLLTIILCSYSKTKAQFTWKQDRTTKEYIILKSNEVLSEGVERFHGISFDSEPNDDGF